ncbi:MAG TPA: amino acid ABC transporter permease [Alphaproteobacteria bacterium]|nr:amino acid ABC transporter permease [Alphaproteobacteria bacterium]
MSITAKAPGALPLPIARALAWARHNLFSSWLNGALTAAALIFLYLTVPPLLEWAVFDAAWTGSGGRACPDPDAACWVFIRARFAQFVYGGYPAVERWRVDLLFALSALGAVALLLPRVPRKGWIAGGVIVLLPSAGVVLLPGGWFGLRAVPTGAWGGLMLTLVVATWGIVTSIPLGLLLALGRRSEMKFVRLFCIAFIELWRGVPLIAVLFMAAIMFPLFVPAGTDFDTLLRALVALSLFNAAYMAEVFRGGLQAVPRGQYEAGRALGLGYWRLTALIVLPQAIRIVVPGIVNTCIAIFKETTVVLVIGLFDLLGAVQAGLADPEWLIGEHVRTSAYVFTALIFWVFCFGLSRYSLRFGNRPSDAPPA